MNLTERFHPVTHPTEVIARIVRERPRGRAWPSRRAAVWLQRAGVAISGVGGGLTFLGATGAPVAAWVGVYTLLAGGCVLSFTAVAR